MQVLTFFKNRQSLTRNHLLKIFAFAACLFAVPAISFSEIYIPPDKIYGGRFGGWTTSNYVPLWTSVNVPSPMGLNKSGNFIYSTSTSAFRIFPINEDYYGSDGTSLNRETLTVPSGFDAASVNLKAINDSGLILGDAIKVVNGFAQRSGIVWFNDGPVDYAQTVAGALPLPYDYVQASSRWDSSQNKYIDACNHYTVSANDIIVNPLALDNNNTVYFTFGTPGTLTGTTDGFCTSTDTSEFNKFAYGIWKSNNGQTTKLPLTQADVVGADGTIKGYVANGDGFNATSVIYKNGVLDDPPAMAIVHINDKGQMVGYDWLNRLAVWLPSSDYGLSAGLNVFQDITVTNHNAFMNTKGEIFFNETYVDGIYTLYSLSLYLPNDAYGMPAGLHRRAQNYSYSVSLAKGITSSGQVLYRTQGSTGKDYVSFLGVVPSVLPPPETPPDAPLDTSGDPIIEETTGDFDYSEEYGDPVDAFTGEFTDSFVPDMFLSGPMPLSFSRYYASKLSRNGVLGKGWLHSFEWKLNLTASEATVETNRGRTITFSLVGGSWVLVANGEAKYQLSENAGNYHLFIPSSGKEYVFDGNGRLILVSDSNGNSHSLSYDASGVLLSAADGSGNTLSFTHDVQGLLTSVSDGARSVNFTYVNSVLSTYMDINGNVTSFAYDNEKQLTVITLPEGNAKTTQTYESGRVVSQVDALGNETLFVYDLDNNVTTVTNPDYGEIAYTFSSTGQLLSVTTTLGEQKSYSYNNAGKRVGINGGDGNGLIRAFSDNGISSVTYPNGGVLNINYAPRTTTSGITTEDISSIEYPDGLTESFTYDANGNITSFTDRAGATTSYLYNGNGQVVSATNATGGVVTKTYTPEGLLLKTTTPLGNNVQNTYDSFGRVTSVAFDDGKTKSFSYDSRGNILSRTDEDGNVTSYSYDMNNMLTTITDPLGNIIRYSYDGMDRLSKITYPSGAEVVYAYDANGNITDLTDAEGATISFEYDAHGNRTQITDGEGSFWTKAFDENNLLLSSTDPAGNTTEYSYDSMNRLSSITRPSGGVSSYTYDIMGHILQKTDPTGRTVNITYNSGRVASISKGSSSSSYSYDAIGNVSAVTDPSGNDWTFAYDQGGLIVQQADPLGNATSYSYDNRSRISKIVFPNAIGEATLTYDGRGNVVGKNFTDGTTLLYTFDGNNYKTGGGGVSLTHDENGLLSNSNGVALTRDLNGRISTLTYESGKAISYTYNNNDDVIEVRDWLGGIITLSYNESGQLTSISRPNNAETTYSYSHDGQIERIVETGKQVNSQIVLSRDAAGRVVSATRSMPVEPTFTQQDQTVSFDAASQVAGTGFDDLGRMITDNALTFSWDLANRLESYNSAIEQVDYTYDDFGRVLTRNDGAALRSFIWNYTMQIPVAAIIDTDGLKEFYIHLPNGRLLYSISSADDSKTFYHFDEQGSTTFLTDGSGSVTDAYAYTPFGEIVGRYGESDNPFTYIGQYGVYNESSGGLYRMGVRIYDAVRGRFLSREPKPNLVDPSLVNPYQYALNDPVNYVDYSGEEPRLPDVSGRHNVDNASTAKKSELVTWLFDTFGLEPRSIGKAEELERVAKVELDGRVVLAKDLRKMQKSTQRAIAASEFASNSALTFKVIDLAMETNEKGARPLAEEGVEQLAEKVAGQNGAAVAGVAVAAVKYYENVDATRNEYDLIRNSHMSQYDVDLAYVREMYKEGTITSDERWEMEMEVHKFYDEMNANASEHVRLGIILDSFEFGKNALKKLIGMP